MVFTQALRSLAVVSMQTCKRGVLASLCLMLLALSGCVDEWVRSEMAAPKIEAACATVANTDTAPARQASQAVYGGRVKSISDGDSMRIVDGHGRNHRVRLAFVDAPEWQQAFGQSSAAALRRRLQGQQVTVVVLQYDQYRREVATVIQDGEDTGLWLLRQGLAWHYHGIARRQQTASWFACYAQVQQQARQQKLGLWARADVLAPWDFRQRQRAADKTFQ